MNQTVIESVTLHLLGGLSFSDFVRVTLVQFCVRSIKEGEGISLHRDTLDSCIMDT